MLTAAKLWEAFKDWLFGRDKLREAAAKKGWPRHCPDCGWFLFCGPANGELWCRFCGWWTTWPPPPRRKPKKRWRPADE
jgi:hypothetical protein